MCEDFFVQTVVAYTYSSRQRTYLILFRRPYVLNKPKVRTQLSL